MQQFTLVKSLLWGRINEIIWDHAAIKVFSNLKYEYNETMYQKTEI